MTITSKDIMALMLLSKVTNFDKKTKNKLYKGLSKYAKLVIDEFWNPSSKNKKIILAAKLLKKYSKLEIPQRGKYCYHCGR